MTSASPRVPLRDAIGDGGIDKRNVHDVVRVSWFHSKSHRAECDPRVFFNGNRSINPDEALALFSCWTSLRCSWSVRQLEV